jgi:hypothetical protein
MFGIKKLWNEMQKRDEEYLARFAPPVKPTVEIVVKEAIQKDISEPVLAIIKELADSSKWQNARSNYSVARIEHIPSKLTLGFTGYNTVDSFSGKLDYIYLCNDSWVTPDEASALGEAFKLFLEDVTRIQKEYKHMGNQMERYKFMEAFVK